MAHRAREGLGASMRRVAVPTGASLVAHGLLFALIVTVTWTASRSLRPPDEAGALVTLEDPAPARRDRAREHPAPMQAEAPPTDLGAVKSAAGVAAPAPAPARSAAGTMRTLKAAPPPEETVRFAGLRARKARRVVFVVDGSGAMIGSLRFVLDELERSVERLDEQQSFQVIIFRDRPGAGGGRLFDEFGTGLTRASAGAKEALTQWLGAITPAGRSNPLDGLERALELKPDAVFLLSRAIRRTGANPKWGAGREAILAELERLNPRDRRTGARSVVIRTIQFVEDDPTGLMAAIAAAHGQGDGSYRLMTLEDLAAGDEPLPDEEPGVTLTTDPAVDRAAALLSDLSASGADAAVLYGLATPAQRSRAGEAADQVARLLDGASEDRVARFLLGRALLVRGCAWTDGTGTTDLVDAIGKLNGAPLSDPAGELVRLASLSRAISAAQGAGATPEGAPDPRELRARLESAPAVDQSRDAGARVEAALCAVYAGETARERMAGADRLRMLLRELSVTGRPDPGLELLAADATARAIAQVAGTDAAAWSAVVEAQLSLTGKPAPDGMLSHAVGVIASLVPRDPGLLETIQPEASVAMAVAAAQAGRTSDAIDAARGAAGRSGSLEAPWAWELAAVLAASGDAHDRWVAADLLTRAAMDGSFDRRTEAAGAALGLARELADAEPDDADGSEQVGRRKYADAIATLLSLNTDLPERDYWALELARLTVGDRSAPVGERVDRALGLLETIPVLSRYAAPAESMYVAIAAPAIDEALARLRDAPPGGAERERACENALALAQRAGRYAQARAMEHTEAFALDAAEVLLAMETRQGAARAAETLSELAGGAQSVRGRVLLAAALARTGRGADAVRTLRPALLELVEPGDDPLGRWLFWEGWTTALEAMSTQGGSGADIRAHLTRLRLIDDSLGGPPWRERLESVGARMEGTQE